MPASTTRIPGLSHYASLTNQRTKFLDVANPDQQPKTLASSIRYDYYDAF
jgi:hypothetical protein